MSGTLEAPVAKLRRAIHHYRTLKALHGGGDNKGRPVICEPQVDGLTYKFRVGEIEPLSPEIPLVLGDAYHNLRSALDCLAFQLHERCFRGRIPPEVVSRSAFPIFTKEPRYSFQHRDRSLRGQLRPTSDWREIKALGNRERAAIEWLQPYKRWNPRWPHPKERVGQWRSGLADVHRFDIIDKHHQPHLVAAVLISVSQPRFPRPVPGFRQVPSFPPRNAPLVELVSNAHVDTWTFRRPPPPEYMDMHPGVSTGIGMEPDPGGKIDVLPNIGGSIWVVAQIIDRFRNRFPPLDASPLLQDLAAVHRTRA